MERHEYTETSLNRIRNYIAKFYNYSFEFDFINLATETVANALYDDDLEDAIERSYYYTENGWTILKKYCFPRSADWKTASRLWEDQITEIYNELKKIAPWED